MARKDLRKFVFTREPAVFDEDNPPWTEEDWRRARPADELPSEVAAAFPRHRGPQKARTKVPVSLRLSPDVVEHFKSGGTGWQTRIDEALREVVKKAG